MNSLPNRAMPELFGALPVGLDMAQALRSMRYTDPTPVQERAIPLLRQGRDVLAQAQTGTGKTAAFGIPLIESMDPRQRHVQAIVLVPTRELCLQVAAELGRLAETSGLRVAAVYGGVGLGNQIAAIARGAAVVVGTPGRVEDLIGRGDLDLRHVRTAILDEADRMLDVGFLPAIERILSRTPRARQTALFSATMPDDVRGLAHRQMRDPETVEVDPERATVDEIEQRFDHVGEEGKLAALCAYLDRPSTYLALVFRRTTYKADRLARDLNRRGYKAAVIHGRRSQAQRERVLADLKSGKLQVLVATDIAARGLDIAGLTHVFNFDLPDTPETYVHRIGRTGRAGERGTAVTLLDESDADGLRALERYLAARKQGQQGTVLPQQSRSSGPRQKNGSRSTPERSRTPAVGRQPDAPVTRSRPEAEPARNVEPERTHARASTSQRRGRNRRGSANRSHPAA